MADAIPAGQNPKEVAAKKRANRKAKNAAKTADERLDALEEKFDKVLDILEKNSQVVSQAPAVDDAERRVLATRDSEQIIRYVGDKAATEGWDEETRKQYQNNLLRLALNSNPHDPDNDRYLIAHPVNAPKVEKRTLPNPRPGNNTVFEVTIIDR